ncbi:MAG TPA: hypothetical protein VGI76_00420 [Solirubrobacteraceae bacterium]|jgi:hypothetical protein
MPRIALIASTAFAALACALLPSGALAHGHHRGHHHARHARHHGRRLHAFGAHNGVGAQQTGSGGSTGSSAPTENVGPTPGSPAGSAGTIVSFTEGVLTIKLGEGEKATTISGKVDEDTEIHCIPAPATTPPATAPTSNTTANAADNGGWSDGQRSDGEPGMHHDDQGSGDDRDGGDRNLEGGQHCQCSTTNLTPGTIVRRAELQLDASGAVFREIVLVG